MGYIYKTTNLLDNKVYIGQRKGKFSSRYLGSGIIITKALEKHGMQNFKLEVIVYSDDKEKLNELEKQYIKEYRNILGKDNVYNISDGGEGHLCKHTQETIKKLQNRVVTEEIKQHMRENHADFSGEKHPRYIQREKRECACGCKKIFECKIISKKMFIQGHSSKGINNPRYNPNKKRINYCCDCGKNICVVSKRCKSCENINRGQVYARP